MANPQGWWVRPGPVPGRIRKGVRRNVGAGVVYVRRTLIADNFAATSHHDVAGNLEEY